MNNQYRYSGRHLTPRMARELIQEIFAGQTAQTQEIISTVDEAHRERGGLPKKAVLHPVTRALTAMKPSGLAENPRNGFWFIPSSTAEKEGVDPDGPETTERLRIKTLDEFMKWASQFDSGESFQQYLFRGVSSADYKIDASAYRRIKKGRDSNEEQDSDFEKFLQINKDLIRDARFRGHDDRNGRKLEDLEILAEFQHYGAATFLMDFTYNALVALWFACKKNSRNGQKDGKVVAVRPNDPKFTGDTGEFSVITLESLEKKIDEFSLDNKKLYRWHPRHQNNRIIAQQSIFLFGVLEINPDEECIIDRGSKEEIRESLRRIYGITEDMLFPDFDGFARQHSQDVPYTQLSAFEYKERGAMAYERREYTDALADFDMAIHLNPDDAEAYYQQGLVKFHSKQYEDAIEDFTRAIELQSDYADAYYNRGFANSELGRYEVAIADYDEAIRINPDDAEAYSQRGLANYRMERIEDAIADYDAAIGLNNNDASVYYNRGGAKSELGRYEVAIADYDEAIRLKPDYVSAYNNRGGAKSELGRYEVAIADYDEAIRLKPDYAEAYYNRGSLKSELGRYEVAIADYDEAIRLKPDYVSAYNNRGGAKSELGRYEVAIADYDEAIRLKPDYVSAYNNRGGAKSELGRYEVAIADYDEAIRLKPDYAEAYYNRGSLKSKLGYFREAEQDLLTALQLAQRAGNEELKLEIEHALRYIGSPIGEETQ